WLIVRFVHLVLDPSEYIGWLFDRRKPAFEGDLRDRFRNLRRDLTYPFERREYPSAREVDGGGFACKCARCFVEHLRNHTRRTGCDHAESDAWKHVRIVRLTGCDHTPVPGD